MSIESGEKAGTQKVLVFTDGSSEISKRDAIQSLGNNATKYQVKEWGLKGASEASAAEPKTEMKSSLLAESQEWTNADNVKITAAVKKVENGLVYFLMADGKVVPYEVSKLSPETIAKLKEMMQKEKPQP